MVWLARCACGLGWVGWGGRVGEMGIEAGVGWELRLGELGINCGRDWGIAAMMGGLMTE